MIVLVDASTHKSPHAKQRFAITAPREPNRTCDIWHSPPLPVATLGVLAVATHSATVCGSFW